MKKNMLRIVLGAFSLVVLLTACEKKPKEPVTEDVIKATIETEDKSLAAIENLNIENINVESNEIKDKSNIVKAEIKAGNDELEIISKYDISFIADEDKWVFEELEQKNRTYQLRSAKVVLTEENVKNLLEKNSVPVTPFEISEPQIDLANKTVVYSILHYKDDWGLKDVYGKCIVTFTHQSLETGWDSGVMTVTDEEIYRWSKEKLVGKWYTAGLFDDEHFYMDITDVNEDDEIIFKVTRYIGDDVQSSFSGTLSEANNYKYEDLYFDGREFGMGQLVFEKGAEKVKMLSKEQVLKAVKNHFSLDVSSDEIQYGVYEQVGDEITVRVYVDREDHIATYNWYYVNVKTGIAKDLCDNEIDLRKYL